MRFLGWLSDPFKGLSDLQLGNQKVTLNHLAVFHFLPRNLPKYCSASFLLVVGISTEKTNPPWRKLQLLGFKPLKVALHESVLLETKDAKDHQARHIWRLWGIYIYPPRNGGCPCYSWGKETSNVSNVPTWYGICNFSGGIFVFNLHTFRRYPLEV